MSTVIIIGAGGAKRAVDKLEEAGPNLSQEQVDTANTFLAKVADFIGSAVTDSDYSKLEAVCEIC